MQNVHRSVMLHETVDVLKVKKDGKYADLTTGFAGHSKYLLSFLDENGRLLCFDQDPYAVSCINSQIGDRKQVTVIHDNFCNLKKNLYEQNVDKLDGIICDLGVSSYQLDEGDRGFSYQHDGPLDMRMSQEGLSAYDVVNTYTKFDLTRIIRDYSEEKFASRIANSIINEREIKPIETTFELAEIVKNAIPAATRRTGGHPARRTFQALRLEVNKELEKLSDTLDDMFDSLAVGGTLSIITFHSLEDKIVKKKFQEFTKGCICPREFPVCNCGMTPRGELPFKFQRPTQEEVESNPRSRSATLRAIKKIKD